MEKSELTSVDMTQVLRSAGFNNNVSSFPTDKSAELGSCKKILTGKVEFNQLASGIDVHVTDCFEMQSGKITSIIEPSININILLKGSVCFELGDKKLTFSADEQPVTFINVTNDQQIFSRYFVKGNIVKKFGLSISHDWLRKRCHSKQDLEQLTSFFAHPISIFHWNDDACWSLQKPLVETLLSLDIHKNFTTRLNVERLSYELLFLLLEKAKAQSANLTIQNRARPISILKAFSDHESRIETLLPEHLSLMELSSKLGASISSLQRYFKQKHGMTLKEYIRTRHLEQARNSIIFDHKTIGEVAYYAGYSHVSNFVTAFKKHFNQTPNQLRKLYVN